MVTPSDKSESSGDENKIEKPKLELIDETHEASNSNSSSEEDKKEEKGPSPSKKQRLKGKNDTEFFGKEGFTSSDSSSSNYSDEKGTTTNPENEKYAKEFFAKMQKLDSKNE